MWRSFQYDENSDTIDSYISKIKQVAALLNNGEPQILELCKNMLSSKLYWILFPINNLRYAADAMKRVLTKEKLDKQLSGQAVASTPFMKVGNASSSGKKISFNMQESIKKQLESLTSIVCNMSIQKEEGKKPFKPQVYPKRGRGQSRYNFDKRDNKDKTLGRCKTDVGIAIEEEVTDKIIIEMIVETEEDKILGETSVLIEVDQGIEVPHLGEMVIDNTIVQMQI